MVGLLPYCVRLDRRFNLSLDRLQVETCRVLHRWKFNRGLQQLGHLVLNMHELPEFARILSSSAE